MIRRKFLMGASGTALLAGCGGAPVHVDDAETRWPPTGTLVDADGVRIHAWDRGAGQPVVMIHGASGNLRDFTFDIAPLLARRYRAVAVDRPGFGYSERSAVRPFDPSAQARVLIAASREMGLEKPILVGHSWGAAVAMAWALADRENVRGVVSVSGAVMPWSEKPILAELIGLDSLLVGFYFDTVRRSMANDGVNRFVNRIFRPQTPPDGYVDHVGGPLALRPVTHSANKDDISNLNASLRRLAPSYGGLDVPFEIISGTEDPIIRPERQPIRLAERLPNARLTLLEGVGHMAHHADPDALIDAVDRLASV